jgi:hypothetical protein
MVGFDDSVPHAESIAVSVPLPDVRVSPTGAAIVE